MNFISRNSVKRIHALASVDYTSVSIRSAKSRKPLVSMYGIYFSILLMILPYMLLLMNVYTNSMFRSKINTLFFNFKENLIGERYIFINNEDFFTVYSNMENTLNTEL